MTNEFILLSRQRVMDWGEWLIETFRLLDIKDHEIITNCHIGRTRFYLLKRGELINVDAYFRMMIYANLKIREKAVRKSIPYDYNKEWQGQFWDLLLVQ